MSAKQTKQTKKNFDSVYGGRKVKSLKVLSRMERVSELILEGKKQYEIAQELKVSPQTVHLDSLNAKEAYYSSIVDHTGAHFYKLLSGSEHLMRVAYEQFYSSMKPKTTHRRKYRKAIPIDGQEPGTDEMQLFEQHQTEETPTVGDKAYLDVISRQLYFQAQMMGYIKSGEIPILPQGGGATVINNNIQSGSTVQINQAPATTVAIEQEDATVIAKLRQIEKLMQEVGGS